MSEVYVMKKIDGFSVEKLASGGVALTGTIYLTNRSWSYFQHLRDETGESLSDVLSKDLISLAYVCDFGEVKDV